MVIGTVGVATTAMRLKNSPLSEKRPPLIASASGWPMTPLTAKTPPVLVPPPLARVKESTEKFCAKTVATVSRVPARPLSVETGEFMSMARLFEWN